MTLTKFYYKLRLKLKYNNANIAISTSNYIGSVDNRWDTVFASYNHGLNLTKENKIRMSEAIYIIIINKLEFIHRKKLKDLTWNIVLHELNQYKFIDSQTLNDIAKIIQEYFSNDKMDDIFYPDNYEMVDYAD